MAESSDQYDYGEHSGAGLDIPDQDLALSLLGRGGLPPINYEAQLRAFRDVLRDQKAARERRLAYIQELNAAAGNAKTNGANEQFINDWCWELEASTYEDAVHSMAVVSMLAPLFEAIFCRAFLAMADWHTTESWLLPSHRRWSMNPKRQWDCHWYGDKKSIVEGIVELGEATGLRRHLPPLFEQPLQALFRYRNAMLHNGLEWPIDELEHFSQQVAGWPNGWFESAQTGAKPSFFYASEAFVNLCLSIADDVVVALGKYVRCDILGRSASSGPNP